MGQKGMDFKHKEVINIKDAIIEGGLKEGFEELKNSGNTLKSSIQGLISGEFKSIEEMKLVTKNGGILDCISFIIDKGISTLSKYTNIDPTVLNILDSSKDLLVDQVSNDIEDKFGKQLEYLEKLENYCDKWKNAYNEKDIEQMNKQYKRIKSYEGKVIQITQILDKVKTIENINSLVNNSNNFKLSSDELELAKKI